MQQRCHTCDIQDCTRCSPEGTVTTAELLLVLTYVCVCPGCHPQDLTEQMISQMVLEIKGSYKISYHANGPEEPPVEIDFSPPW